MEKQPGVQYKNISELRNNFGWYIGMGVGLMILGILAIFVPLVATFAIEFIIGVLFIIGGIMLLYNAVRWRKSGGRVSSILISLVYLAVGVLLLAYPLTGVITLTFLLAFFFVATGIFKVVQAFEMRSASGWGWTLASGVLSLILGVILFAGMPWTALWAIGLIVGIDLLFSGFSMIMVSIAIRGSVERGEVICIWGTCYST